MHKQTIKSKQVVEAVASKGAKNKKKARAAKVSTPKLNEEE